MSRLPFFAAPAVAGLSILAFVSSAKADRFGNGANAFDIEFVTIGDLGNPADTTGNPNPAGSVPYRYRIGKFEISEEMIDKATALADLDITHDGRGADKPATSITWFEAAEFVNWLNASTGHSPAYKFETIDGRPPVTEFALWQPGDAGYDPDNQFRNRLAKYFLPSADEWYKAAYYDPASGEYFSFPTGSNVPPTPVASRQSPAARPRGRRWLCKAYRRTGRHYAGGRPEPIWHDGPRRQCRRVGRNSAGSAQQRSSGVARCTRRWMGHVPFWAIVDPSLCVAAF
jgi:Sulfatase-modifying factor enzyme 1